MFKTGLDNQDRMRVGRGIFYAGCKMGWDIQGSIGAGEIIKTRLMHCLVFTLRYSKVY